MTKSSAFALPMVRCSNEMLDSYGEFVCDYPNEVCAEFAVNAINHADALADALASVLEAYFSKGGVTTVVAASALESLKAYTGSSALEAYRGAK